MKMTRLLLLMMVVCSVLALPLYGQVAKTNAWTDFAGIQCTINALPMPPGCIIQTFDQSGVLCGQDTTESTGMYGATPTYGDDAFTLGVDEGCILNEQVTFRVNGIVSNTLGPATDLWKNIGPIQVVNLASIQNFDLNAAGPDDGLGDAGEDVHYLVDIANEGNGIDLVSVALSNTQGWTISHDQSSLVFYLFPGVTKTIEVVVHIPVSAVVGTEDILTVTATSQFDPSTSGSKNITTTVDQATSVSESDYVIPGQFSLAQNYPNPFNPETKISFKLEKNGNVNLDVFDILGRRVSSLYSGFLSSGQHEFTWYGVDQHGQQVSSGIYFYRLASNDVTLTRKMTLLK